MNINLYTKALRIYHLQKVSYKILKFLHRPINSYLELHAVAKRSKTKLEYRDIKISGVLYCNAKSTWQFYGPKILT